MFIVRVCDAIMGKGKSSAAITYINEHPQNKFIYITPYLDEANRIKTACPDLRFVEPSNKLPDCNFKKSLHTAVLIKEGRNIATTHQAFKSYTQSMLDDIHNQGYTLIIDENVDVLESFSFCPGDLQMAIEAGYIAEDNGVYILTGKEYVGRALSSLFALLRSRKLIRIKEDDDTCLYYWRLPPDLITSFENVFILTYLFEGQSLHHLLEIYKIPYSYINVSRSDNGVYRFTEGTGYTPKYVFELKNKIHILDNEKMNYLGHNKNALSMAWFDRGGEDIEQLKKNIRNCFINIWKDIPSSRRLWGAYSGVYGKMRGGGYARVFLPFNTKATNAYRDRDHLVYIANCFMNVGEKLFYQSHGVEVDEDVYALSIMVQWIWRSAIRDGKDIYIYIPSSRMRNLLINWINSFSEGGEPVA